MTQVVQIGNRTISPTEIIPLLAGYQMLPQLGRELVIDYAIAEIELKSEEYAIAKEQFEKKHQLTTVAERQAWCEHYGMTLEQLEALAMRELRIEKFKLATWGHRLESYFLTHKSKLDKVIYSLLRTRDAEIAQELYFRIQAQEQSFAELAREYSTGPEAQTGGLLGPVELSLPHPQLAKMLSISQPGQLWSPTQLGEWFVIVRLEKLIGAQLDEVMRQQLLNSLFEAWINEQLNQLNAVRTQNTSGLVAV
jgi:parvulin-like peptidyl-prolyl isomerase